MHAAWRAACPEQRKLSPRYFPSRLGVQRSPNEYVEW